MSEHVMVRRKGPATPTPISVSAGEEPLQRAAVVPQHELNGVPPIVNEVLQSSGQPLDAETRAFMEPRFGHDFGQVRVHTDERAVESAEAVNALAYTVGKDVVFGASQYAPTTTEGKRMLAHELAHSIQQGALLSPQGLLSVGSATDRAELEADQAAGSLAPTTKSPKGYNESHMVQAEGRTLPMVQRQTRAHDASASDATQDAEIQAELDADFHFIVQKLDVFYYSHSDEAAVFAVLTKWASRPNPPHSHPRPGSRYLEQLLMKLQRKSKDVGILTTQQSNYYTQLFKRSSRLDDLRTLRDTSAPLYAGDEGVREVSFGGVLWENVEQGVVRDQIYAYGRGLARGVYAGAKGMVTLFRHPIQTVQGVYHAIAHFDETKSGVKALASKYWETASEDPVKFAEMTGELTGQVEVAIAGPKFMAKGGNLAVSGAARLAGTTQRWAKIGLTASTLGVGNVVPKISGGSSFMSASTLGTTARAASIAEQVGGQASNAARIEQAAQFANDAVQVVEDATDIAQQSVQSVQAGASGTGAASEVGSTAANVGSEASPAAAGALTKSADAAAIDQALDATFTANEQATPFATTQRLIRGNLGERLAAEALAADGHHVLMYKPSILGTNQGGIDIVTIRNGVVHLIDNKALMQGGNVSSVPALTTNFAQNLAATQEELVAMLAEPARSAAERALIQQALTALRDGQFVRAVTNANVVARDSQILTGVTSRLSDQGISFIDVYGSGGG
jgi:Domain of unknown function (DUF4157)